MKAQLEIPGLLEALATLSEQVKCLEKKLEASADDLWLTPAQAGKMLGCSDRHICKLQDERVLTLHTLPGSNHRRVSKKELLEVMQKHTYPALKKVG